MLEASDGSSRKDGLPQNSSKANYALTSTNMPNLKWRTQTLYPSLMMTS